MKWIRITGFTETKLLDSANYTNDYDKMQSLDIVKLGTEYWLASRATVSSQDETDFRIYWVGGGGMIPNGEIAYSYFCAVFANGEKYPDMGYTERGFRPVLHLAYSAKIKNDGGDGSSTKPFVLE